MNNTEMSQTARDTLEWYLVGVSNIIIEEEGDTLKIQVKRNPYFLQVDTKAFIPEYSEGVSWLSSSI